MHVHGERPVYRRISKIWGFKVVDGCKTVHASQIVFCKNSAFKTQKAKSVL